MPHLVLAYPVLSTLDLNLIQEFRKVHDQPFYSIVMPHFTFVFPTIVYEEKEFIREAMQKSEGMEKIDFTIRCATVNKDAFSGSYHTRLVPDEGYGRIVRLHDRLYSGLFSTELRLDIDYVPHMGVGCSTDPYECKKWVDEWNNKEFSIQGQITALTISKFEENKVTSLEVIDLI